MAGHNSPQVLKPSFFPQQEVIQYSFLHSLKEANTKALKARVKKKKLTAAYTVNWIKTKSLDFRDAQDCAVSAHLNPQVKKFDRKKMHFGRHAKHKLKATCECTTSFLLKKIIVLLFLKKKKKNTCKILFDWFCTKVSPFSLRKLKKPSPIQVYLAIKYLLYFMLQNFLWN